MDSVELKLPLSSIDVKQVVEMQQTTVARWHQVEIDNPYEGVMATICRQHSFNYQLWHQEDIARCPDSDDSVIADVKRAIDGFNQQRNDGIEQIDDEISQLLEATGVSTGENVPLNTETPGSAIDRLSILALRIYHLQEQLDRDDASAEHKASVAKKLAICLLQKDDLSRSLQELLDDIFAGRKRQRTYRQFKMYNDPTLNPYLYKATSRKTA